MRLSALALSERVATSLIDPTSPSGRAARDSAPRRIAIREVGVAAYTRQRSSRRDRGRERCHGEHAASSDAVVRLNCVSSVVTCVLGTVIRGDLRSIKRRTAPGPGGVYVLPARSGLVAALRPGRWRTRTCRQRRAEPEASPRPDAHWSSPPSAAGARTRRRPARRAFAPARHRRPGTSATGTALPGSDTGQTRPGLRTRLPMMWR